MGTHYLMRWLWLASVLWLVPSSARADDRLIDDDTFKVTSTGQLGIDAGLLVAAPSALPSGISTGVVAGVTRECGCHLAYGVRASYSTTTQGSEIWTVTHSDVRLRAIGSVRQVVGRGSLALRLGVGPTVVHEVRLRNQAMREGRTDLDTRAWGTVPAADLEAVFAVHVAGPWLALASGGPALDYFGGGVNLGWLATLGVAWQP